VNRRATPSGTSPAASARRRRSSKRSDAVGRAWGGQRLRCAWTQPGRPSSSRGARQGDSRGARRPLRRAQHLPHRGYRHGVRDPSLRARRETPPRPVPVGDERTRRAPQTLLDVLRGAARRRPGGGVRVFRGADEVERLTHSSSWTRRAASRAASSRRRRRRAGGGSPWSSRTRANFSRRSSDGRRGCGAGPAPPPLRFSSRQRYGQRIRGALLRSRVGCLLTTESCSRYSEHSSASLGLRTRVRSLAEVRRGSPSWAPVAPMTPPSSSTRRGAPPRRGAPCSRTGRSSPTWPGDPPAVVSQFAPAMSVGLAAGS